MSIDVGSDLASTAREELKEALRRLGVNDRLDTLTSQIWLAATRSGKEFRLARTFTGPDSYEREPRLRAVLFFLGTKEFEELWKQLTRHGTFCATSVGVSVSDKDGVLIVRLSVSYD